MVKTAASHAVNIGSNPVRVTNLLLDKATNGRYNTVCSSDENPMDNRVGAD